MARPRPEPRGVRAGAAPEALERVLGLLGGEAGALVGDAQAGAVPVALDGDRDPALAVVARVADQVADCALERRALAADDHRLGRVHVVGVRLVGELGEVDGLAAHRRRGVLAGEREQVVEQVAEPCGVASMSSSTSGSAPCLVT